MSDPSLATPARNAEPAAGGHSSWFDAIRHEHGAGLHVRKATRLADLHRARADHKGQFFTPDAVAAYLWRLVTPAMERALRERPDALVSILDNSIGSGRLVQFAERGKHSVSGYDIDAPRVEQLASALAEAGITSDVRPGCMTHLRPGGFSIALLNPPFSLHLESTDLKPYPCTAWGRFGANTSTVSHAYALHQALEAAQIVVAVLPRTYATELLGDAAMADRLRAVLQLPAGVFRPEGANVATCVVVFGGPAPGRPCLVAKADLDAPRVPDLDLACTATRAGESWMLDQRDEDGAAVIPGEVTGIRTVRVVKAGRRLALRFACALVHAKVMNAVLRARLVRDEDHRYAKGVRFLGEGLLDLEAILATADPLATFRDLLRQIEHAGGAPEPDPAIERFLTRRARRYARERTPFGHWIRAEQAPRPMRVRCLRKRQLARGTIGSPILQAGAELELQVDTEGAYRITKDGQSAAVQASELGADFEVIDEGGTAGGWVQAHPGRAAAFPMLARSIRARAQATGAAAVASWDYQLEDLVELRMSRGALAAWAMGCGKSRLAIALCLMGGAHNAIVVEPHLVGEIVDQLREANVDANQWQVIRHPDQCRALRRINIITYNRLRAPVCEGAGRRTYASLLRRRLATVCADECHRLRNESTEQTRAILALSPRRRYGMTGTPIANYIQDILPLATWASGDGTCVQPFGKHHAYLTERNARSMAHVPRGVDEFRAAFTVFEWVTREFEDGLRKGAKRQVPKVRNVHRLRAWAAPLIKRRTTDEPAVKAHFRVPSATITTTPVDWDEEHLPYALRPGNVFPQCDRLHHHLSGPGL